MLKSVTVTNFRDESIYLELENPYETGLAITNITGLGPAKANINVTDLATSDGANYNSARVGTRNIVFTIRLLEDPETQLIETTRLRSYKFFPVKKTVTLTFETDHRIAQIQGYVESNEPDIFSKEEQIQVSIVCPSPYFYTLDHTIVLNGVEPLFQFPFSNNSFTEKLLFMGNIVESISTNYIYDGDVDSGALFHIHASGHVKNIMVYNSVTRERMSIDTTVIKSITNSEYDDLIFGDDVYLSTISGDRYIYLVRSGQQYNILPSIPKITDWVKMVKGDNIFGYTAEEGKTNMIIEIHTNILYEGV